MAVGAHFYQSPGHSAADGFGQGYSVGQEGTFNRAVTLRSLFLMSYDGSGTFTPCVWRSSDAMLLATGPAVTGVSTTTPTEAPLDGAGVTLAANTPYRIGFHTSSGWVRAGPSSAAHAHGPAGGSFTFNLTVQGAHATASNSPGFPNNLQTNYELVVGMSVDIPNAAPGPGEARTPNSVYVDPAKPITLAWAYSDPEGSPQAQFEISWREANDNFTNWSAPVTVTSAANSYVLPANTWAPNKKYVWRVRVSDGSLWSSYGEAAVDTTAILVVEGTTATSHTFPADTFTEGNYQLQVRAANAKGFGPWSAAQSFAVVASNTSYFNGSTLLPAEKFYFNGTAWLPTSVASQITVGYPDPPAQWKGSLTTATAGLYRLTPQATASPSPLATGSGSIKSVWINTVAAATVAFFTVDAAHVVRAISSNKTTTGTGWESFSVNLDIEAGDRLGVWISGGVSAVRMYSGLATEDRTYGVTSPTARPVVGGNANGTAGPVQQAMLPMLYGVGFAA